MSIDRYFSKGCFVNINKQNNDGNTPLHLASKHWTKNIIKALLKFGADLSIRNNENKYPLKRVPESIILDVVFYSIWHIRHGRGT